jgi:hypothetical protein
MTNSIINVEVFVKEMKMVIRSQVSSHDIFGDTFNLDYQIKVKILSSLSERMFIVSDENNYILRMEK